MDLGDAVRVFADAVPRRVAFVAVDAAVRRRVEGAAAGQEALDI